MILDRFVRHAAVATFIALASACGGGEPLLRVASPSELPRIALPERVQAPAPAPAKSATAPRIVVLVAIDGVRWQELFGGVDPALARLHGVPPAERTGPDGLAPNLQALMTADGAALGAPDHGAGFYASDAIVKSLPGYMEMLSGHAETRCLSNFCAPIDRPTLLDALADRGAAPGEAAVIASWQGIGRAAALHPGRVLVSTGRSGGHHRELLAWDDASRQRFGAGERASPLPGYMDYRPDRRTAPIAVGYLKEKRPSFLFVGLGDTDEQAHADQYRQYLAAIRAADRAVGEIRQVLAGFEKNGYETALLVTTDHGRDDDCVDHGPSRTAARGWLVAGGSLVRARGLVASPIERHLADVAPTIRVLLGLPADETPGVGQPLTELQPVPAG